MLLGEPSIIYSFNPESFCFSNSLHISSGAVFWLPNFYNPLTSSVSLAISSKNIGPKLIIGYCVIRDISCACVDFPEPGFPNIIILDFINLIKLN